MKKDLIFAKIQRTPGISSQEMADYFNVSRIAIYYHLKKLLSEEKISYTGNRNSTRYFTLEKENTIVNDSFFERIKDELVDSYDGFEKVEIKELLNELLSYLRADGKWIYGIEAFHEKIYKENNLQIPSEKLLQERVLDFFYSFLDEERKRRKNGLFSGIESLKNILKNYEMPLYIDELYFTQIAYLSGFGRIRGANEIYWGKKDQSEKLLSLGIQRGIDSISNYLSKNEIQCCIYTPPTLKRKVQFRSVLKKSFLDKKIILNEISCSKKQIVGNTLKPQKDTSKSERIINARSSMVLQDMSPYLHIPKIIIFDDNFTTGATVNAIAEMMRKQNYTGKIISITLTGNFQYIPGITDEGDI